MLSRVFAKAHTLALDYHGRIQGRAPVQRGVCAKKKDSHGELYIYEGIGGSFWGGGITAKDVAAQLDTLKGAKTLDVFINSEGGDVFEGKAIYNLLKRFDAEKTVHIDGIAASAASFIAMAGDKIITAENATWMIHEASGLAMGGAADMRALADVLDAENQSIAGIYAARTGQPTSNYWGRETPSAASTGLMAVETWLNADQAMAAKLTDEITRNVPVEDVVDEALAAKAPALRLAAETQRNIAASKTHRAAVLADMAQSILNDRLRASPKAKRPAARSATPTSGA